MTKRFTLADYISTLRLGKRNKQIYFSLYDCGDSKTQKAKPLFEFIKFPFDKETNKIIAQNHEDTFLLFLTPIILILNGVNLILV